MQPPLPGFRSRLLRFTGRVLPGILLSFSRLHALTIDPGGPSPVGIHSSAAMVDGRPGIAYSDSARLAVRFVRAADANGAAWESPVIVDTGNSVGGEVSLAIVNGHPAVCYFDFDLERMMFVRATDPAGTAWGTPVLLDAGRSYTLEIVDGKPAVGFIGGCCDELMYVRAVDADGSSWETARTVDGADGFAECTMRIVQGRPAFACTGEGTAGSPRVWYVRASDSTGTAWDAPAAVAPLSAALFQDRVSLQDVNGRPAVCFLDNLNGDLKYVRAMDAAGVTWPLPVRVDRVGERGRLPSLTVVNGRPAIGFQTLNTLDLMCVRATDSNGDAAAAWSTPVTVDSIGETGMSASLLQVSGVPALIYHDATTGSLEFIRATDASSGTLWPPDIVLQEANGTPIPPGGIIPFGVVTQGNWSSRNFILKNPNNGSAGLNIHSVTIDGPDAPEFSITGPPASVVAATGASIFTVRYTPLTSGVKSAVLHISSNAEGSGGLYEIHLTGATIPDIVLEHPAGSMVTDGGSITFPLTGAGAVKDFVLTVRNPGAALLNGLTLAIDGPDAGEFSLITAPSPVPPGGSTSLTVRHAPAAGGRKTAVLHLASNVAGSKNPFDLTVNMVPGFPDATFQPATGPVLAMVLLPDGKILTSNADGILRFNANGTDDLGFFPPPVDGGLVRCMTMQKDGAILAGGDFERIGGRPRPGLARLFPDGTIDESFVTGFDATVRGLAVQPDGKILAGGIFNVPVEGGPRYLVRLNPDGSLDSAFDPRPDSIVLCFAVQTDGKILCGGYFNAMASVPARCIARLHPNGAVDPLSTVFDGEVRSLAVHSGGGILAGGAFTGGLARLLPNGNRDTSIATTGAGVIHQLALQADGRCLVAGAFGTLGGAVRNRIARVNSDSSLDTAFKPDADGTISCLAIQADGGVLVAGTFTSVGGVARVNLARLQNEPAATMLKVEGGTTARWLRSGAAPEINDVSFEILTPGSSDSLLLGAATRASGGWELTGPEFPYFRNLRARGLTGYSVVESTVAILTDIEYWRLQHFRSIVNTGNSADNADPDGDGLVNLVEFAFGLSPVQRENRTLPEFHRLDGALTASFTSPAATAGVIYGVEASPSMLPGTWTPVPDTGAGGDHKFRIPDSSERMFVRFVIQMSQDQPR